MYAADDELFEPAFERFMARELLGIDPIELSGGHFVMVEDPGAVAELLDRLARSRTRLGVKLATAPGFRLCQTLLRSSFVERFPVSFGGCSDS